MEGHVDSGKDRKGQLRVSGYLAIRRARLSSHATVS
jgi:hypothetical protein